MRRRPACGHRDDPIASAGAARCYSAPAPQRWETIMAAQRWTARSAWPALAAPRSRCAAWTASGPACSPWPSRLSSTRARAGLEKARLRRCGARCQGRRLVLRASAGPRPAAHGHVLRRPGWPRAKSCRSQCRNARMRSMSWTRASRRSGFRRAGRDDRESYARSSRCASALSPEGDLVWFDASPKTAAAEVHRLERSSGSVVCWTCDEPDTSRRRAEGRRAVAFETIRYVTWRERAPAHQRRGAAPSMPLHPTTTPADRAPVLGPEGGLSSGRARRPVARSWWSGHSRRPRRPAGRADGSGARRPRSGDAAGVVERRAQRDLRPRHRPETAAFRFDPATGVETPSVTRRSRAPAGTSSDGGWLALATSTPRGGCAAARGSASPSHRWRRRARRRCVARRERRTDRRRHRRSRGRAHGRRTRSVRHGARSRPAARHTRRCRGAAGGRSSIAIQRASR